MKILSNKQYNELLNRNKVLENAINDKDYQYKKEIQEYQFLIEEVNYNLSDIISQMKNKISKDKIITKLKLIIKQIGGKK